MAVRANQRIGVIDVIFLVVVHATREIFQIDLMDNTKTRRDHTKRIKRLHAPFQKLIAFFISLEFNLHIQVECFVAAKIINHHRVVNDQIDRNEGLDRLGFFTHLLGD